ncbi:hypothetical protein J1605_018542 [Eschrichtius robustus]|uniref:Uncharacterized protein n=1 Tax=Eschrichtius robustus TaxID=9764 RepID=A0AB34HVG3_ESCRO|nr:hypothetical protein J1605_018542 [Eschrichtius robustus]
MAIGTPSEEVAISLSASLASCPSHPAPSGLLTAGSGLESSGGCSSLRNPVKFHRSRRGEQRSNFTDAGGALVFAATGLRRRVRELETCLSCCAASLLREAPPPAALGFSCLEGQGESLPRVSSGGGGTRAVSGPLARGLECRTSLGKGLPGTRAAEVPSLVRWPLRLLRADGCSS